MTLPELTGAAGITDSQVLHPKRQAYPKELQALLSRDRCEAAMSEIESWPHYQPSPLRNLAPLAAELELGEIRYLDESQRFGLGSFKALGGAFAVLRYLSTRVGAPIADIRAGLNERAVSGVTVATATDGNHGRSVAWGAQQAGCQCKIFIHKHVSEGRQKAMEQFGAEVIRVDGDYDHSVRVCDAEARKNGWQVISDTSYDGYQDIPLDVMAGYSLMAREILASMIQPPSHVFLQAGVGGMAAAVSAYLWMMTGLHRPKIVLVESDRAACLIRSLRDGAPASVPVVEETVMAGLSCGEPSSVAYDILKELTDLAITISDDQVASWMRGMAYGTISGEKITAGECAVPGLIGLCAVIRSPDLAKHLELGEKSRIAVIGCEGATDPEIYAELVGSA